MAQESQLGSLEERRLALEERKWADEVALRKVELDAQLRESTWSAKLLSPLTAPILAGVLAIAGSVLATLAQNAGALKLEREKFNATKDLEERKFTASKALDSQKQQHELILKMIGVDNVEQARTNVRFLAETKLITDESLAARLLAARETPLIKPPAAPSPQSPAGILTGDDIRRLVSEEALRMMIAAEGGGVDVYDKRPRWLGEFGGITIGIGYDLGHTAADKFKEDWASYLSHSDLEHLASAIGKTGTAAQSLVGQFSQIEIKWEDAVAVFQNTLPRWATALERNVPNVRDLPPDAYGALVSLVYNRGTPFKSSGERYSEMREIRALMERKEYASVPQQLRGMKRLWPNFPVLSTRRENEARLFEKGLAQLTLPSPQ